VVEKVQDAHDYNPDEYEGLIHGGDSDVRW
jgi:hypothetical protein